ncbi:MAG TPA: hemerythrin [Armatimonadetes bacterium]|jgi:hemerythrin-like domain-containing protein|nr:hemerythrin [Armatimonadota bacterium]
MYATDQLRDEHESIQVVLSVLERLSEDLQSKRTINLDHAAGILDFLRTFADRCHHGKEEDLLFPTLAARGVPVKNGPIGVMLSEHAQGRAYIRAMGEALKQERAGGNGAREFAANALGYIALLRAHIVKENQVLFPMAERRLTAAEHSHLATEFERIEKERVGPGVHEKYHALISNWRDAYLSATRA